MIIHGYIILLFLLILLFFISNLNFNIFIIFLIFLIFFILFFFRESYHQYTYYKKCVYSPCNGKIVNIEEIDTNYKISIFISILDEHFNVMPFSGRIKSIVRKDGEYTHAKYETLNARVTTVIETKYGEMTMEQITGLFARRILNSLKEGETYCTGEKFGFIMLGSKMTLTIPKDNFTLVRQVGDKVSIGNILALIL